MGWLGIETGRVCSNPTASLLCGIYLRLKHKWTYYLSKLSDIEELLESSERAISDTQIPSIRGHTCTMSERQLLALPVRKGDWD